MTKLISSIVILLALYLQPMAVNSQIGRSMTYSDVRLKKDKPTVYLTFDQAGKRQSLSTDESDQGVWLRLHNNSIWSIYLASFDIGEAATDAKKTDEIGIVYDIEVVGQYTENTTPPVGNRPHVYGTKKLASGDSLVFSLPRENLAQGLAIYVIFTYEWEIEGGRPKSNEPKHRVYFYSYNLPDK